MKLLLTVCLGLTGVFMLCGITAVRYNFPLWNEHIHANVNVIRAGEGLVRDALFTLIDLALAGFIILVLPIILIARLLEIAWSKFTR